jgi:hypothetical protein
MKMNNENKIHIIHILDVDPWTIRLPSAGFGGITTENNNGFNDVYLYSPGKSFKIGARLDWGAVLTFFGLRLFSICSLFFLSSSLPLFLFISSSSSRPLVLSSSRPLFLSSSLPLVLSSSRPLILSIALSSSSYLPLPLFLSSSSSPSLSLSPSLLSPSLPLFLPILSYLSYSVLFYPILSYSILFYPLMLYVVQIQLKLQMYWMIMTLGGKFKLRCTMLSVHFRCFKFCFMKYLSFFLKKKKLLFLFSHVHKMQLVRNLVLKAVELQLPF